MLSDAVELLQTENNRCSPTHAQSLWYINETQWVLGPLCQIAMLVRASPRGFSVDVRSDYTQIRRGGFVAAGNLSEMSNVPREKKEMARPMRSRTPTFLLFAAQEISSPSPGFFPCLSSILIRASYDINYDRHQLNGGDDIVAQLLRVVHGGLGTEKRERVCAESADSAVPFSTFVSDGSLQRNPAIQLNARLLDKRN